MSLKVILTKGLPGSGKSTWAKKIVADNPGAYKRVCKDDLRAMLDSGKYSGSNEKFVLTVRDSIVVHALTSGKHVIVDDTNLDPKHEVKLREIAKAHGAQFVIQDFTHVPLEICIENDLNRLSSVGKDVILGMYNKYLKPAPAQPPAYHPHLQEALIVDIDGTVAAIKDRSPYEWAKVGQDEVRWPVVNVVKAMAYNLKDTKAVIFVSGRDEVCRAETTDWLKSKAGFNMDKAHLFMRLQGDQRRDSLVKREIYDSHILGKYNVVAVIDDRPQVLREVWQALGFQDRLFNVGDGTEF